MCLGVKIEMYIPFIYQKKLFELYLELSLKVITRLCTTKQDKKSFV